MNIEKLEKMASGSQKHASFLAGRLARIVYDKIKANKNPSKEDASQVDGNKSGENARHDNGSVDFSQRFLEEYKRAMLKEKRKRALNNALIAAGIGGAGGAVLSKGNIPSVLGSAAASGIGTYLLNRF